MDNPTGMKMPQSRSLEERKQIVLDYINSYPIEFFENIEVKSLVQNHWSDTKPPKPHGYQITISKQQLSELERVREMVGFDHEEE